MEKEFVDEGIKIIFIGFGVTEDRGQEKCSYLPVTIDLEQRCMIVKVWNQHGIIQESRPQVQLDNVVYNKIRMFKHC